ncbi:MAG: hypothetical protein H7257_14080 [Taibaiella sp.]|nr:hypothetical protein [Taibaiella sp.]
MIPDTSEEEWQLKTAGIIDTRVHARTGALRQTRASWELFRKFKCKKLREMHYRYLLLIFFLTSTLCFAQSDSNKYQNELVVFNENHIAWGCLCVPDLNNRNIISDSFLFSTYSNLGPGHLRLTIIDTYAYVRGILLAAKKNSKNVCLLPFLRVLDRKSDKIYGYTCVTTSYKIPNKVYCDEPSIRFAILFYVNFNFTLKYSLPKHFSFNKIELQKNNQSGLNTLDQNDYDKIYDAYLEWAYRKYVKREGGLLHPLANTEYRWAVETVPSLSKKQLKIFKRRRRY